MFGCPHFHARQFGALHFGAAEGNPDELSRAKVGADVRGGFAGMPGRGFGATARPGFGAEVRR